MTPIQQPTVLAVGITLLTRSPLSSSPTPAAAKRYNAMKTYSVSIATIVVLSCTASQASLVLLDSGSNSLRSIAFGAATDLAVGYKISFATSQTVAAFGLYDASNNAASGFQGDGLVSN